MAAKMRSILENASDPLAESFLKMSDVHSFEPLLRELVSRRGGLFVEEVQEWKRSVGRHRIIVVHTASLRNAPSETFDRLTAFLGLPPFPSGITFHRYNTHGRW